MLGLHVCVFIHFQMEIPMEMMPILIGPLLPLASGRLNQMWCKLLNPLETRLLFLFVFQRCRFCLLLMTLPQVSYGFSGKWGWLCLDLAKFQLYVYAGSSLDASVQSLPEEEPVTSENILSVADYADDIHQHMREGDVSNCCNLLLSSTLSHFCSFDLLNFFLKSVIAVIWYWALYFPLYVPFLLSWLVKLDFVKSFSWDIGQSLVTRASSQTSAWGSALLIGWLKFLRNTSYVQKWSLLLWITWTASSPAWLFSDGNCNYLGLLQFFWLPK